MTDQQTISFTPPAKEDQCVIAWLDNGTTEGLFTESIANAMMTASWPAGPIAGFLRLQSSPRIAEARSIVVEKFLTDEKFKGIGYLLMVDADMTFTHEHVRQIMATANVDERPVVGGLCYAGSGPHNMYPTVFELIRDNPGDPLDVAPVTEHPTDQPFKVGATGAAFLLVHRGVLQLMYSSFKTLPDGKPNPYPWFVEGHVDKNGHPLGEDVAFCVKCQAIGVSVWIDPAVKIGHVKKLVLDEALWEKSRP